MRGIMRSVAQVQLTTTLANGLTLSYVDEGDVSAPAVVLLGGLTDSWRTYEPVLPHLPTSIRAIAVSQRGHGDSDKPESGYRTRDFAADVAQFLRALGLTSFTVVGHSSAGLVARRLAIDHPAMTTGIVLEASPVTLRGDPGLAAFVASLATLSDPLDPEFVRGVVARTGGRIDPSFRDAMVAECLKMPARVWRLAFGGLLEDDDDTAELRLITAPTLLVWGDQDTLVGRVHQEKLGALLPNSVLVSYQGVGHTPHWEEPERFAADVASFAQRAGQRKE
jgi:non-heme chloroperoxidase